MSVLKCFWCLMPPSSHNSKKTIVANQSPLKFRLSPNGRSATLLEAATFNFLGGPSLEIPVGFHTDFASVPRWLWCIVPPWGRYSPATVFHDFLYSKALLPRWLIDWNFLEHMKKLGVKPWRCRVMYWCVRIFGRKHYKAKI